MGRVKHWQDERCTYQDEPRWTTESAPCRPGKPAKLWLSALLPVLFCWLCRAPPPRLREGKHFATWQLQQHCPHFHPTCFCLLLPPQSVNPSVSLTTRLPLVGWLTACLCSLSCPSTLSCLSVCRSVCVYPVPCVPSVRSSGRVWSGPVLPCKILSGPLLCSPDFILPLSLTQYRSVNQSVGHSLTQ